MDVEEYCKHLDEISPKREIDLAWAIAEGGITGDRTTELKRRWTEKDADTSEIGLQRAKQIGWEQRWTKSEGP